MPGIFRKIELVNVALLQGPALRGRLTAKIELAITRIDATTHVVLSMEPPVRIELPIAGGCYRAILRGGERRPGLRMRHASLPRSDVRNGAAPPEARAATGRVVPRREDRADVRLRRARRLHGRVVGRIPATVASGAGQPYRRI